MPLLNLHQLTMRFGGLTAVKDLDLTVEPGQIVSVIGPNGAGKTTAFNAITGIYEPTEGIITFEGKELRRPMTWKVRLACIAVGVITALAAMLVSVNPDLLWKATIKRNMQAGRENFTYAAAGRDFMAYLRGEPRVETTRAGKWIVVEPAVDGALAVADQREDAEDLAVLLESAAAEGTAVRKLKTSRGTILATDGELAQLLDNQISRQRTLLVAIVLGFAVGTVSAFVTWNRSRRTPDVITAGGLARTFQNIRLFRDMTVLENVQVGIDRTLSSNPLRMVLRTPGQRRQEGNGRERAREVLKFVGLDAKAAALASALAYGDQRRLEIARALATGPRLLLLDEPAAGMNPSEAAELTELIRKIRDTGVTVLLIEHHMNVVMGISDRIAVLDHGCKIAEGSPADVRSNPTVIEAYLGKDEDH